MKRTNLLLFILLAFGALFLFGCKDKPVTPPSPETTWPNKAVSEISVADEQLAKEYDIDEWDELSKSFMVNVTFEDGETLEFPITNEHFTIPDSDLNKLKKVNRVRVHLSVDDDETTEITFYLVMVSYAAQEEFAITNALDNMILVYREDGFIVFKLQKNGNNINGGVLSYTYTAGAITLGEPVLTLNESGEQVTCLTDASRIQIYFAAENLENGAIICKIPFTGDYRAANISEAGTSNVAYYADGDVVEVSNNNVTYYTSLK